MFLASFSVFTPSLPCPSTSALCFETPHGMGLVTPAAVGYSLLDAA
jgi:hypothetical protein